MPLRILGISGSARKRSYNTALLHEAMRLLPADATLEMATIADLPLFNEELEENPPDAVRGFKQKVMHADALLFATPEYNRAIPAALKNAIEWGNRPDEHNVWDGKPGAIVSASTGPRGGARAQMLLRQICIDLNVYIMNRPEFLLGNAAKEFDNNLRLVDESTRSRLRQVIESLVSWTALVRNIPR